MVRIDPPPPSHTPSPLISILPAGHHLIRIFDPSDQHSTATSHRFYGSLRRFDHHLPGPAGPARSQRGIYYAGLTLSGCLVEVFGDTRVIAFGEKHVARPRLLRDIQLLDLRGNGAMRAGSVAALAKVADYALSQAWSRYFYENEAIYTRVDGIRYSNAHNDEEAIALYERSSDTLFCSDEDIVRLDDEDLRPAILEIALASGMIVLSTQ